MDVMSWGLVFRLNPILRTSANFSAGPAQAVDWPRLAGAWGSLRCVCSSLHNLQNPTKIAPQATPGELLRRVIWR